MRNIHRPRDLSSALHSAADVFYRFSRLMPSIILITCFSVSLFVHFSHLGYWRRHEAFTYDRGKPFMTTLDAYHYLQEAAGLGGNGKEEPPLPHGETGASLLARVAAVVHQATGFPLEQIAFYLPPLLGSCMVVVYVCWGYALAGPVVALLANLAGVSSVYWYSRTCLGRFDTDCLNPFFLYAILFLVYRFVSSKGRLRAAYLGAAILTAYLFGIWWTQVRSVGFIVIIASYALSFYLPSGKAERALKVLTLAGIGIVLLCVVSGLHSLLPQGLNTFMSSYAGQFALINKGGASFSPFPDVGASISELQPLSLAVLAKEVSGHFVPFLLALAGLCSILIRKKKTACCLLPALVLASLSFTARRFLIFFIPAYALGLGFFLGEILPKWILPRLPITKLVKQIVLAVVCAALLLPGFYLSMTRHIGPVVGRSDLLLARRLENGSPQNAVIWAWWDYGYFLRYITGRRVFIDGGTQSGERTFIAAFPLTCEDPLLARNWMRFFAAHDLEALDVLAYLLGSPARALSFLQQILAQPDHSSQILKAHGWPEEKWRRYLFPDAPVFLYLNRGLFGKTYWWYYFGTWDPERGEGVHPDFRIARMKDRQKLLQDGLVTIDGQAVKVGQLIEVGRTRGEVQRIGPATGGEPQPRTGENGSGGGAGLEHGRTAVVQSNSSLVYVLDDRYLRSLAFRLSFLLPHGTPGFDPLFFSPAVGGAWRVE